MSLVNHSIRIEAILILSYRVIKLFCFLEKASTKELNLIPTL